MHCKDDTTNLTAVKALELLLYPVPRRFFVVLHNRNRLFRRLQLHLLCECGIYDDEQELTALEITARSEVDTDFEVEDDPVDHPRSHLSNHPGYKVKRPTEFCQDLGSHLLPVLKLLHYGAIFAGIVVPALASVNVSGWYTTAQSFVNYNNQSWSEPWFRTIEYVSELCNVQMDLNVDEAEIPEMDIPRAIQYPQYRQYQAHLKVLDPHKVYGNLIPIFCNRTGHLKYVCKDHDDDETNGEELLDYLETLDSSVILNRAKGQLSFLLESNAVTKQIYRSLIDAPRIRKIDIALGSSTSGNKLKELIQKLAEANIVNIAIDGSKVKNPGSWYNNILKLMVNKRCQELRLFGFKHFYTHISGIRDSSSNRLKILVLDCELCDDHRDKLKIILGLCPALRNLTLRSVYANKLYSDIYRALPHLKRLELVGDSYTTTTRITKDPNGAAVLTTAMTFSGPRDRNLQPLAGALYPHLAILRLYWLTSLEGSFETWLTDALQCCPRLQTLDLRLPLKYFRAMVTILRLEFNAVNALHGNLDARRVTRLHSAEGEHEVTMVVTAQGPVYDFDIKIEMTGEKESNEHLQSIFRAYGPTVRSLVANCLMDDHLLGTLIGAVRNMNSNIYHLSIDPAGLSDSSLVDNIIRMSPDLIEFTLSFSSLEDRVRSEQALQYMDLYGGQATGLMLRGDGTLDWLSQTIPVRLHLGRLLHFEIAFEGRGGFHSEEAVALVLRFISWSPSLSFSPAVTSLHSFTLSNCDLAPEHWSRILIHLDLRALKHLSVENTNFGAEQMEILIGRLPKPTATPRLIQQSLALPLDELVIKDTTLVKDMRKLARLETKLLLRAPNMKVIVD